MTPGRNEGEKRESQTPKRGQRGVKWRQSGLSERVVEWSQSGLSLTLARHPAILKRIKGGLENKL